LLTARKQLQASGSCVKQQIAGEIQKSVKNPTQQRVKSFENELSTQIKRGRLKCGLPQNAEKGSEGEQLT